MKNYSFLLVLCLFLPVLLARKENPLHSKEQRYAAEIGFMNGVNLGGWLVTEPSWMYDQFQAPAELDLINNWRAQGGDDYALNTIHNHWKNYFSSSDLDKIQEFGITHARIPIGYWIVDVPTNSSTGTYYDYGFNAEGFATGGINYLEGMIADLKKRGIQVIIDLHAPPGGGSSCQSYSGVIQNDENLGFWRGYPWVGSESPGSDCLGGPYSTSRSSSTPWLTLGENFLLNVAQWIVDIQSNSSLSDTVCGLELCNEPALGWGGMQSDVEGFISTMVPKVQLLFNQNGLSNIDIDTNWIGPNDYNAGPWLAEQQTNSWDSTPATIVDFHNYYNWDGSETWSQLSSLVCGPNSASPWNQYVTSNPPQSLWIGEWSDSSNLGDQAYNNFSDPGVADNLATFHANQMSLYFTSPYVIGQFYWTLRMGSGWKPWPTDDCPEGCQVAGTSSSQSLLSFQYRVWNLLELMENNIAQPLSKYNITGLCECNGCDGDVPFQLNWQPGDECMYAQQCDFPNHDIGNQNVPSYQCSEACGNYDGCTNFAWTGYAGGTCYFKSGDLPPSDAVQSTQWGSLCGILTYQGAWQTTSSSFSSYGTGCDFIENNISNSTQKSLDDCENVCEKDYSCTNYVFVNSTCYLKRG